MSTPTLAMSETAQVALYAMIPPTLLALGTLISQWRASAKIDVVSAHVNSEATAMRSKIKALEDENAAVKEESAKREKSEALALQALLITQVQHSPSQAAAKIPSAITDAPAVLTSIDKNTKDTARNTANTDAKVNEAINDKGAT